MNTQTLVTSVIALILGLAFGVTLGIRKRPNATGTGFAFLGLGLGLALGLSASPVLGATLTAAFTFVGLILQAFVQVAPPDDKSSPRKFVDFVRVNASMVSVAIAPFSSMLVAGLLVGIVVRVNDSLQFSKAGLRDRYIEEGFDEAQVTQIMAGHVKMLAEGRQTLAESAKTPEQPLGIRSVLQTSESTATWQALLQDNILKGDTPQASVKRIRNASHELVKNHIDRMRAAQMDDESILNLLKDIKAWELRE